MTGARNNKAPGHLDDGLWSVVEGEAERRGVSLAEYIRSVLTAIAAGVGEAVEPGGDSRFSRGARARAAAASARSEARALTAQSAQALRQAAEVRRP